jgi:hypothetical protein
MRRKVCAPTRLDDMREQWDRWQAQAERLAALAHYLATINVEGDSYASRSRRAGCKLLCLWEAS